MADSVLKVAIMGRPNVGKSTLFNRLTSRNRAITQDEEGITRDYVVAAGKLFDLTLKLYDTAGLIPNKALVNQELFFEQIKDQLIAVINECDVIFFVCDGSVGITELDIKFSRWLHKYCDNSKIVLIANKVETTIDPKEFKPGVLWLPEFFPISALHYTGFSPIYQHLKKLLLKKTLEPLTSIDPQPKGDKPIVISLFGRPNVGKSTLLNALIDQKRSIVSDMAGTTVDTIEQEIEVQVGSRTQKFCIIDTAGVRRSSKIDKKDLEGRAVEKSFDTLYQSDVVVLILDASAKMLEKQDLHLFSIIAKANSIPLVLLNKIDLLDGVTRHMLHKQMEEIFAKKMSQVHKVKTIAISALNGKGVKEIYREAIALYHKAHTTITTGVLNRWLQKCVYEHAPPRVSGKPVKLKYAVLTRVNPITVTLFTNMLGLNAAYKRYLSNSLANDFELYGIPIKLVFKTGENPYT